MNWSGCVILKFQLIADIILHQLSYQKRVVKEDKIFFISVANISIFVSVHWSKLWFEICEEKNMFLVSAAKYGENYWDN